MIHIADDVPLLLKEVTIKEFNVHQINAIDTLYPKLRQASKAPTFA